jgi:hypothetical protein
VVEILSPTTQPDLTHPSSPYNLRRPNVWTHNNAFCLRPAIKPLRTVSTSILSETHFRSQLILWIAGVPLEKAMGSRTSVHVGCLVQEYSQISRRDTDLPGSYQIVGSSGLAMLANRLSWFYDFTGPSMTVDTACSGSLLAVHLACQDLLSGSVDMVDFVHYN